MLFYPDRHAEVLQRRETGYLEAWATRRPRKPIVIRGARQVGKSTLVREFARVAGLTLVTVDFERDPELREAFTGRGPARILALLKLLTGTTAAPGTHLLFLDEIQAAPEALAALRYFHEEMPDLHVLAAGSLLEFALAQTPFPMPVGRVEYMHLGPMHFEDFVTAMGEADLADYMRGFSSRDVRKDALPVALHRKCLDLLRRYWVVGGLPEAVAAFVSAGGLDFEPVARVLQSIVATYRDDFAKYGRSRDRIRMVFDKLPHLVARKFKYVEVSREHRAAEIGAALEHLCMARVVSRVFRTAANGVPLAAEVNERFFKCLHVDVGLMCAALGLDLLDLEREGDPTLVNRGAVAEQFVGQHLLFSVNYFCRLTTTIFAGSGRRGLRISLDRSTPRHAACSRLRRSASPLVCLEQHSPRVAPNPAVRRVAVSVVVGRDAPVQAGPQGPQLPSEPRGGRRVTRRAVAERRTCAAR